LPSFLNVLFSFNRGPLLANCVESIRRFHPESPVVVFDDNSSDPETLRVLERIAGAGSEVVPSGPVKGPPYGNLYVNMNRALDLAASRGHEFVHFVQDDTQFVWRRADLVEHVTAIFRGHPNAYQMQVHFLKRLGQSHAEPLRDLRAYRILTPGGDLGFFHVGRVRERGLEFGPTEKAWATRAAALGLEAYGTADPVMARIPWPKKTGQGTTRGRVVGGARDFLIRPLDALAVSRLVSRDVEQRPYGEDWCVPWGWRCWQPYPTDPSYARWTRAIVTTAVRRRSLRGLTPRRVGDFSEPPA
jgi:hypothetical protein